MKKFLVTTLVFIAGITCGLIFNYGPLHAEGENGNSEIIAKLDEVSKGQAEIMAAINSMKEDLRIIKIRVTQSQ